MRAIRVYDDKGRERWLSRPGQLVPAGWYDSDCQPVITELITDIAVECVNAYDQDCHNERRLVLRPHNQCKNQCKQ